MAFGTLKADTLTHSTAGSLATNFVVNGSAKQWANFDGTGTASVTESFNTSTLTDGGTGDHTLSFTNAMATANYMKVCDSGAGGTDASCETSTTSQYEVHNRRNDNNNAIDREDTSASVHGDLA